MNKIILYSNNCPKCKILKEKLKDNHIDFTEENNEIIMLSKGFVDVPVLEVDDTRYSFGEAVKWIQTRKGVKI
jgi:glutaredoxin-related protein